MKKVVLALVTCAMLSITVTGCGLLSELVNLGKPMFVKGEKTDWFEENEYTINGVGDYEFRSYIDYTDKDGSKTPVPMTMNGTVEITETDNGDGTKTVKAEFVYAPYVFEDGAWSTARGYYFVADRYSGEAFVNEYYELKEDFTVKYEDGTKLDVSILLNRNFIDNANMNQIESLEVTVPSNYDGVVFGFMGRKTLIPDDFWGKTYTVKELVIEDENCDLLFFAD